MDKNSILCFVYFIWIMQILGQFSETSPLTDIKRDTRYRVAFQDHAFMKEPDINFDHFDNINTRNARSTTFREGDATTTHSCGNIRDVPEELRNAEYYKPNGLDEFYQKYTEAYGIPIVASANVSDDALQRTCYVIRHLFSGKQAIRSSFYKRYGRIAIIGADEKTTDIPEYSCYPESANDRSRGYGATDSIPVSSAGEENIMCYCNGRYFREDILVHEVVHGIHLLGARYVLDGWEDRLKKHFDEVKSQGLWKDTYAMTNHVEYFAEGAQSYFNVNEHQDTANGVHGPISTGARLKQYDPVLYQLIQEVFPCNNQFIKRCESTREMELQQNITMDCPTIEQQPEGDSSEEGGVGFGSSVKCFGDCVDNSDYCVMWAASGECEKNPVYMYNNCKVSCKLCLSSEEPKCEDNNESCLNWAKSGECDKNPGYMLVNCKKSCDKCTVGKRSVSKYNDGGQVPLRELMPYDDISIDSEKKRITRETNEAKLKKGGYEANNDTAVCKDTSGMCPCWALGGDCIRNPGWMYYNCQLSCNTCPPTTSDENCKDDNDTCHYWAFIGECEKNPGYMLYNCKRSCKVC